MSFHLPLDIGTPRSSGEKDKEGLRLEAEVMRTLKDIPETTHSEVSRGSKTGIADISKCTGAFFA